MKRITKIIGLLIWFGIHSGLQAQVKQQITDETILEESFQSLSELRSFLSLPNDANNQEDILKNIEFLENAFSKRGFETQRISTEGSPLFYAEWMVPGADSTVLFYMHFDGQPVDSSKWSQQSPYIPVLKKKGMDGLWQNIQWPDKVNELEPETRIFARSASDDKSPIIILLSALDVIQQEGITPSFNIKVILDSEEEKGSPHLYEAVNKNRSLLDANRFVILDGPRHTSNRPTLLFGARGIALLRIETFGPSVPQHSGHYGNYAPNPAFTMAEMLASMKDKDGRVTIDGFYDGITINEETSQILKSVPDDESKIQSGLGVTEVEKVGGNYQEAIQYPSLNINGFSSGWVGDKTRTIVPSQAVAHLDLRLVPEKSGAIMIELVRKHLLSEGYKLVDSESEYGIRPVHPKTIIFESNIYNRPFRTDMNAPISLWLRMVVENTFHDDPVLIRMTGGSVPISHFIDNLNIPAVIIPLVQADNNQHSPNENLRLGNYIEGIKLITNLLQSPYNFKVGG